MVCATFVRRILSGVCLLLGAGAAEAQTLTIVAGNGQLVLQNIISPPLTVSIRDASGKPIPNVPAAQVKWTVTNGPGNVVLQPGAVSDANGQLSANFVAAQPPTLASYAQSTVTATYSGSSVQFIETSVGTTSNVPDVQAYATPQPSGANLTGAAGQQGSVAIHVQFLVTLGPQSGQGIGNVALTLTMDNPSDPSTIACVGGTAYSNATGVATCTLVYGGKIGAGSFTLSAGGLQNFNYHYQVVAGAPAVINIISGNNQKGSPGKPVPSPLVAQLTDIGGNPLAGIPMTFSALVPGTVTFSHFNAATDTTGRISATATLGNVAGTVQAKLSTADGSVSTIFTLTVNIVVAGMTKLAGDGQSVLVNTQFPNSLIVEVIDVNNQPVAGVSVTFAVSSGSATVGASTVNTGSNGQAGTTVTAGPDAGPITVTASTVAGTNTYSQIFNLTSTPPGPVCDPENTFFNGASFAANFISPGGVAVIYCKGLAPGIEGVVTSNSYGFGPLPTQVQNVTVRFDGVLAPIYYLANINGKESVAVQVPFETKPGSAVPVVITVNGEQNVSPLTAQVWTGATGFFETVMSDGNSRAILVRSDGSLVDLEHKANQGETLTAFVTGMIPPTDSSGNSVIKTNEFAPPGSDVTITTPIIIGVGSEGVAPPSAIYAHNLIGVWQVQFTVPSDAPSGNDIFLNLGIPDPNNNGKLIVNQRGSKIPIK
jgi:uncharacterized protein (TIGR03437 family)